MPNSSLFFVLKELRIESGVHGKIKLLSQVGDGLEVGRPHWVAQNDVAGWRRWPDRLGASRRCKACADLHRTLPPVEIVVGDGLTRRAGPSGH